jgi:hypothetical protein
MAILPVEELARCRIVALRTDYRGKLLPESITGQGCLSGDAPTWHLWVLVNRGHMSLLEPAPDFDAVAWLQLRRQQAQGVLDTPAWGWSFYYDQRHGHPESAPGAVCCRLCKGKKAGHRRSAGALRSAAVTALVSQPQAGAAGVVVVPGKQLRLKELCAGKAVITRAWRRLGHEAYEPVEVFEDPHAKQGYRRSHDLTYPDVQLVHLTAAADPEAENVGWIATPCTSFCDWGLENGGTRSFDQPEGGTGGRALTPVETTGNVLGDFGAKYFMTMLEAEKFPIAESSAPSGRYPKVWDLPSWKAILDRPDIEHRDFPMCGFGLGPPDTPGLFYVHRTRLVARKTQGFWQLWLRFCPGISEAHQHTPLKGNRPGVRASRCTEAGVYAEGFCSAVMEAVAHTVRAKLAHEASPSTWQPSAAAAPFVPIKELGEGQTRPPDPRSIRTRTHRRAGLRHRQRKRLGVILKPLGAPRPSANRQGKRLGVILKPLRAPRPSSRAGAATIAPIGSPAGHAEGSASANVGPTSRRVLGL